MIITALYILTCGNSCVTDSESAVVAEVWPKKWAAFFEVSQGGEKCSPFYNACLLAASAAASAAGGASASAGALLELSVQAFGQFLLGGVADCEDLACEVEGLAGHGMVEVHHDAVVLDFMDFAVHYAALLVHHRYHVADCEETFLNLSVHFEDVLGQLDYHVGVVLAVAFGRSEGELKCVTGLLAGYVLLELGQ